MNKSLSNDTQNNFVPKIFSKITITFRIIITCLFGINNSINYKIKIIKNYLYGLFNNFLMVLWHLLVWLDDYRNSKEYLANLDTTEFDQTLLVMEHIDFFAETYSNSIAEIIKNSKIIHDDILINLINLFKGNISYNIIKSKVLNKKINYLGQSNITISFSDSLLLLSNNMRILISPKVN